MLLTAEESAFSGQSNWPSGTRKTAPAKARLEGSRAHKTVDLAVEIPARRPGYGLILTLTPLHLAAPAGLRDQAMWRQARRGWFGAWQPSAQWGDQGNPYSAPAGILANNVISDPASVSCWFYADQAFWTPTIAPGISVMPLVQRTVDWWLDNRTRPTGEVVGYWAYGNFLDANAGPLIAAWDYVEATQDHAWLARRIERLEFIADFLARRDVDGDGLVEATQSGNRGTLQQPARSCAWWDALNCGHKDAYCNALIYRAWRCLADLELKLGRTGPQTRYQQLANRLKAAYFRELFNPETGWLAWWKSADGEFHDYASPVVNGLAIEYGLIEYPTSKEVLARLRAKINWAGFNRFDIGLPSNLLPVRRGDYLLPDSLGCPKRNDGTDTFGQYMNGGVTAGHVLHFLAAHYVIGESVPADAILQAMLGRQAKGGFQNGVRDAAGQGVDWTNWEGKPCGYEGYLADNFRFLQAVLLREKVFRDRLYRPLGEATGVRGLPALSLAKVPHMPCQNRSGELGFAANINGSPQRSRCGWDRLAPHRFGARLSEPFCTAQNQCGRAWAWGTGCGDSPRSSGINQRDPGQRSDAGPGNLEWQYSRRIPWIGCAVGNCSARRALDLPFLGADPGASQQSCLLAAAGLGGRVYPGTATGGRHRASGKDAAVCRCTRWAE
jgi:hypothetical protein